MKVFRRSVGRPLRRVERPATSSVSLPVIYVTSSSTDRQIGFPIRCPWRLRSVVTAGLTPQRTQSYAPTTLIVKSADVVLRHICQAVDDRPGRHFPARCPPSVRRRIPAPHSPGPATCACPGGPTPSTDAGDRRRAPMSPAWRPSSPAQRSRRVSHPEATEAPASPVPVRKRARPRRRCACRGAAPTTYRATNGPRPPVRRRR